MFFGAKFWMEYTNSLNIFSIISFQKSAHQPDQCVQLKLAL
jgi:hypothetical protein